MSAPSGDILVLGIGNILLQDEGVGVQVARALAEAVESGDVELPPGTRVVDGGTLGLDLLPLLEGARAVIFVDAVDLGLYPGSTTVVRDEHVRPALRTVHSAHELGLAELIETARLARHLPESLSIIGVQVGSVGAGLDLTPAVAGAVLETVDLARREAWARAAT